MQIREGKLIRKLFGMLASALVITGAGTLLVVATVGMGSPQTFNARLSGEAVAQDPYGSTPTPTVADQAPVFTAFPAGTVYPGAALSFQIAATDPDGDPVTISWSQLPLAPVTVTCTASGNGSKTPSVTCSLTPYSSIDATDDIIFTASDGRGGVTTHKVSVGPAYYVAMGDSYAAGEGVPPFNPGTDIPQSTRKASKNTCHRSNASWNFGLEATTPYVMEDFIACSGAKSENLLSTPQYDTQPVQVDTLKQEPHAPSMVSLSIGGNDIGFHDVAVACFTDLIRSNCGSAVERGMIRVESDAFKAQLTEDMKQIHMAAPVAKIELVGYPNVMTLSPHASRVCPWLTPAAQGNVVAFVREIARVQSSTVSQMPASWNVHYINTLDTLQGHELCTSRPYVNSITDIIYQPSHLSAAALQDLLQEIGHPNFAGQQAMLGVVTDAIRGQG